VTQLGSPATASDPDGSAGLPAAHGSRLARRRRVLLAAGLAAALLAVGGLIGAAFVKSPQQLAADTAPPPATPVTAPVVSRVLTSSVQMRGVVYPATEYDVYPSAPADTGTGGAAASSAAGGAGGSPVYISGLDIAAGDSVASGRQLAEIDGQPLFALAGTVPAWRDLTPGETGPDVTELQRALARLGYYDDGDTPGYYGPATESAVAGYFEHLGYPPPVTGGVPLADVVFLPSLPATVVAVNGARGEQPGQPFLELAARGSLALTGELPPAYAGQVKHGLKASIYDEVTGLHATGRVRDLGTATTLAPAGAVVDVGGGAAAASSAAAAESGSAGAGTDSSGSSGSSAAAVFIPLNVHPSRPLAAALNGENVLVTVQTGRTEGAVLAVPVAAVVTTASGTSSVTVTGARGRRTVRVTPGLSQNGYVQVTPATPGALAAGDNVVVSGR
jgi:peptidoglycan hydrolase-like protein with peptidoglycan-binding domain